MAYTAYKYVSDDGTTYQLVLPSDFAVALNYTPATGYEPYLPVYIFPRYATYQDNQIAIWTSAVVTLPYTQFQVPESISVGAQIYFHKSSVGEQRGALTNQQVITVAGPQGPPGSAGPAGPTGPAGPSGIVAYGSVKLSISAAVNVSNTPIDLVSLALPGAGTYFLCAPYYIAPNGGTYQTSISIYDSTAGTYIVTGQEMAQTATNENGNTGSLSCIYTSSGANTITLRGTYIAGNALFPALSAGHQTVTGLQYIQFS